MKKSHSRFFTDFLAKSSKWSKFSKMYKKFWKVTNRFSADIWWNDFRIDFPTTSESNSFPFQAFEFSSTRGLSWDQISLISPKNFKNNYFENKFPNFEFSKNCKNRKFFDSKYFWSIHKKDCDTKSAAWFGLVTLSPETHGCPPCPEALRLLLVIVSAFLGLVYPSSRFKRSFSVWFVFHSKTLFSSRPITDSTNTLDFTSV